MKKDESIITGVCWMIACTLAFVTVTAIVRYLGSDLPASQAAFIRYAFGIVILAPTFIKLTKNPPPKNLLVIFGARGFVHALAVILWFFAMARIPIAEVTAIGYVTPIFVTIGAALFLGEKLRIRRIIGVTAGLVGALVILRPGFEHISIGQLAQLATAPLFAISFLLTKNLTNKTDTNTIVAMLTLFCTLFLIPFAIAEWKTPTVNELFWLFITAITATVGHYTLTKALEAAPISATQPITFLQIVWASIVGVAMFGEPIDPFVIAGSTIIVAAATFISHREAKSAKAITPPAGATKLQ